MKHIFSFLLIAALFYGCKNSEETNKKPNIIYFLADDLGYGEVGVYGQQKIQTPNMDAL
jgi:hypothetical protein